MVAILGISAYYHDSAAALVVDGRIVAAAQEERFTRLKHDAAFPTHAVRYCLEEGGCTPGDLEFVCFYEKPLLKFDRLLETYLAFAPVGFRSFLKSMPVWLGDKLFMQRDLRRGVNAGREQREAYQKRIVFTEHHESHAASAFFPSPFERAAILTLDGVGEWATAAFGVGEGNRVDLTHDLQFPHSLGLLYSAFTYYCGFKVNSGEYKLMGLAPYGEPKYVDVLRERLIDLRPDGSLRLNMDYFNYCQGLTMTSARFDRLFGGPPRRPEQELTRREMDLAASVQVVAEEAMVRAARHVRAVTGMENLCLAGGVALNCVGNGQILRDGSFNDVWIQPAAGDAGGALGAALFVWHQLLENPRLPASPDGQQGSLLGPRFTPAYVARFLESEKAVYQSFESDAHLCQAVAAELASGGVVGWFQGRMEFGPRALGARSILADPRRPDMQSLLNQKIKFRESFRPFAPAVLLERAADYFAISAERESPYMLLTVPVAEKQLLPTSEESLQGFDRLRVQRSTIPAVTHVDGSARVQTIDEHRHPSFWRLLRAFEAQTGCPVLVNTSFNVRGEPIVCTPEHAYRCFMATEMDVLVLENCLLLKSAQPIENRRRSGDYLAHLSPD